MSLISAIGGFIGSLFSNSRASDTAIDIIRNVSGANELTEKEKLDFIKDHIKETKHQSPTRRFISIMVVLGLMAFTGSYLIVSVVARFYLFYGGDIADAQHLFSLTNDIYIMMKEVLLQPFNIVLGFYFVNQMVKGIKS